jgi:hypothetical protein
MAENSLSKMIKISPCIVALDKSFLVGAIYGLNAARKRLEENPLPLIGKEEINEDEEQPLYLGHWLELTCAKCGCLYPFSNPNEIPITNLICRCGNHIIVYGVGDPKMWRIGEIILV